MKTAGSAAWFAGVAAVLFVLTPSLGADHHWWNGSLHWPAFPVVDVTVGDNVSADWTPFLDEAVLDWNAGHPDFTDVVELMLVFGRPHCGLFKMSMASPRTVNIGRSSCLAAQPR